MTAMTEQRPDRPKTTPRSTGRTEDALDVETVVVEDRGQWAVEVVVVFPDGVVRNRSTSVGPRPGRNWPPA